MRAQALVLGCLIARAAAAEPATTPPLPIAPASPVHESEPEPPVLWSMVAGLATAIVPLAVGGGITALADVHDDRRKRTGIDVITIGVGLAPLVSHLVAREWKRAALFSAVPLAAAAVAIGLLEGSDDLLDNGAIGPRVTFGAVLAVDIMASGIGLIDSFMARDRWKRHALMIIPTAGPQRAGLSLGGSW